MCRPDNKIKITHFHLPNPFYDNFHHSLGYFTSQRDTSVLHVLMEDAHFRNVLFRSDGGMYTLLQQIFGNSELLEHCGPMPMASIFRLGPPIFFYKITMPYGK